MKSDSLFLAIGEFGRYQIAVICFITILGVIGHSDFIGYTLFYYVPDHKCVIPNNVLTNSTLTKIEAYNLTLDEAFQVEKIEDDELVEDHCRVYVQPRISTEPEPDTEQCSKWTFDLGYPFGSTFVSTFNMLCEYKFRRALGQSLTAIGFLIGATSFGSLSDQFGRVKILALVAALKCCFNWLLVLSEITDQLWLFYLSYLFLCACSHGLYLVMFVYIIEITGPRMRLFAPALRSLFEVIEDVYCLGFVYLFKDWTRYQMLMGTCGFLMLLVLKVCHESPLWLISKGLESKAEYVLTKIAEFNRRAIPPEHLKNFIRQAIEEERAPPSELNHNSSSASVYSSCLNVRYLSSSCLGKIHDLRIFVRSYPKLCMKGAVLCLNWCIVAAAYYAIFFSVPNLSGDQYFNLFLISVLDYPVYLFCYLGMERYGRKLTYLVSMVSGGVAGLLIMVFRQAEAHTFVTVFSLVGAMCFSSCFTIIYIWTSEVFPTPIRNFSMGFCSLCGRIGMSIVPFFLLVGVVAEATVCMLAFLAALLASMLPETNKIQLPQTLEEAERVGLGFLPGGLRPLSAKFGGLFQSKYNREYFNENGINESNQGVESRRPEVEGDGVGSSNRNGKPTLEFSSVTSDYPKVATSEVLVVPPSGINEDNEDDGPTYNLEI